VTLALSAGLVKVIPEWVANKVPGGADPLTEGPIVRNSLNLAPSSVDSAMDTSTEEQSTMEGMR